MLADEVNRAPAKVQSALLEAMQERQVTIGDQAFPLPSPFSCWRRRTRSSRRARIPLPEAQLDRFLFKLVLDYPEIAEERLILEPHGARRAATQGTPRRRHAGYSAAAPCSTKSTWNRNCATTSSTWWTPRAIPRGTA